VQVSAPAPARDSADVPISRGARPLEKIAEGVYRFAGRGAAVGIVVGDTSVVLIDTGAAEDSTALRAALASVTRLPVRHVVNTHFHADHVGGNRPFLEAGAAVIAHEATPEMLRREGALVLEGAPREIETLEGMKTALWPAEPAEAKERETRRTVTGILDRMIATWRANLERARTLDPDLEPYPTETFRDRKALEIAGRRLEIFTLEPRTHARGEAAVQLAEERILFVGDLWSPRWLPWADVRCGEGSLAGLLRSLRSLTDRYGVDPAWKVVPGHGEPSTLAALREGTEVAEAVRESVLASRGAGKSRAEAVRAIPRETLRGHRDPLRFTWLVYDEAEKDSVPSGAGSPK
jgi:glyoxylase-like metal-dependent hydrolase (beta-lactamase superfamily II)